MESRKSLWIGSRKAGETERGVTMETTTTRQRAKVRKAATQEVHPFRVKNKVKDVPKGGGCPLSGNSQKTGLPSNRRGEGGAKGGAEGGAEAVLRLVVTISRQ